MVKLISKTSALELDIFACLCGLRPVPATSVNLPFGFISTTLFEDDDGDKSLLDILWNRFLS